MTFDPKSLTPSDELIKEESDWYCVIAARWDAIQTGRQQRHGEVNPITDRPPTEEDGDEKGQVQILDEGSWITAHWTFVNLSYSGELTVGREGPGCLGPWLHTPSWSPKPEPTPQEKALALLALCRAKCYPERSSYEFSLQELDLLIQALKLAANS